MCRSASISESFVSRILILDGNAFWIAIVALIPIISEKPIIMSVFFMVFRLEKNK